MLDFLRNRAQALPVVLPLRPHTRQAAERFDLDFEGLQVIDPVGYLVMAALIDGCAEVLMDTGALQREAYFHRKPCITLRGETEWIETVETGWNRLWNMDGYKLRKEIDEYGDGQAARRIVEIISRFVTGTAPALPASAICNAAASE